MFEQEKHNIVQLEGDALVQAVKDDFGLQIENPEKIIRGLSNQVYEATYHGEKIYIRINKDANKFKVEIEGYKIFENQGIPVPKVIAFKESPNSIGQPTMILEAAQGKEINKSGLSKTEKEEIYENVGALMKKMHETKLEGYGSLDFADGVLSGRFSSPAEFWKSKDTEHAQVLRFLVENSFISDTEAKKLKQVYEEIAMLDFGVASLLHLDIHSAHIFVEEGKVSGIIDLGGLTSGDPRNDIAMSLIFQNAKEQEAFKRGYGELAYDQAVIKYMAVIAARKAQLRTKRGQKQEAVDSALTRLHECLSQL